MPSLIQLRPVAVEMESISHNSFKERESESFGEFVIRSSEGLVAEAGINQMPLTILQPLIRLVSQSFCMRRSDKWNFFEVSFTEI